MCIHICTHVYMCIDMCISVRYIYIYMYVYTYVCMCIYAYATYTYVGVCRDTCIHMLYMYDVRPGCFLLSGSVVHAVLGFVAGVVVCGFPSARLRTQGMELVQILPWFLRCPFAVDPGGRPYADRLCVVVSCSFHPAQSDPTLGAVTSAVTLVRQTTWLRISVCVVHMPAQPERSHSSAISADWFAVFLLGFRLVGNRSSAPGASLWVLSFRRGRWRLPAFLGQVVNSTVALRCAGCGVCTLSTSASV